MLNFTDPHEQNAIEILSNATALLSEVKDAPTAKKLADTAAAAEVYARKMRLGAEAIEFAAGIRIDSTRLLGHYLQKMPKAKGAAGGGKKKGPRGAYTEPRDTTPTLSDLNIDKKISSLSQRLAKMPDVEYRQFRADVIKHALGLKAAPASERGDDYDGDEWYTPRRYLELAREVLGAIDLDPASCDTAQKIVCAERYFTAEDDGLSKPWAGRVWMNPPFSKGEGFASKLLEEFNCGAVTAAIVLQNAATDVDWFHNLARHGEVCFPKGRISFLDDQGNEIKGNRAGQVFFYLGTEVELFRQVFGQLGLVGRLESRIGN